MKEEPAAPVRQEPVPPAEKASVPEHSAEPKEQKQEEKKEVAEEVSEPRPSAPVREQTAEKKTARPERTFVNSSGAAASDRRFVLYLRRDAFFLCPGALFFPVCFFSSRHSISP